MATEATTKQAQRLWPRWLVAGSRPIKVDLGPAGSGHLVDISGGGLRVQSLAPLKRGAEIPVRLDIPDKPEPLQCSGIVVWSKSNGAAGIRFTTLIESQQAMLRGWLDELQKIATSPHEFHQRDEFTNILSHIRAAQLNQADALKVIAVRATELTPASGAAIALGTSENMICLAASGVAPEVGTAIPQGTSLTGDCILRRKMVHCQNAKGDPRVGSGFSFGSAVVLPLIVSNEVRGVLEVFAFQANAFDEDAIETLERLADAVIFTSYGVVAQRRLVSSKQTGSGMAGTSSGSLVGSSATAVAPERTKVPGSLSTIEPAVVASASGRVLVPQPGGLRPAMSASAVSTAVATQSSIAARRETGATLNADGDLLGIESLEEGFIEEAPREIPFIQIPPQLKEEPARKQSGAGKWAFAMLALVLVGGGAAWRFVWVTNHAASETTAANVQSAPVPEPAVSSATQTPTAAPVTVAQPPKAVTTNSSSASLGGIVPSPSKNTSSPKPESKADTEKKSEVVKAETKSGEGKPENKSGEAKTSDQKPLLLSPSTGKIPRSEETEVANAAPISIPAEGSMAQLILPASGSAPKLVAAPARVRSGGTLLKRIEPVYPTMARSSGLQGQVELQFRILKDGSVSDVRRVSGQSVLANAAIEAVRRWRYEPVKINGDAIEVESTVRLNFTLSR